MIWKLIGIHLSECGDMKEGNFRYAASNKNLEDKIMVKMEHGADKIYWHIKFNLNLSPETVTNETMYVTDLGGYVLESDIEYNVKSNQIVISPRESYEENYYYILNITTKVKSERGQNLRKPVIILFKLMENEITDMKILPSNTKTPEPIKRPKNYEPLEVKSKVYSDETIYDNIMGDKLSKLSLKLNPIPTVISVVVATVLVFVDTILGILGLGVALIILGMLLQKVFSKTTRAVILYNSGVNSFNAQDYDSASDKIKKAYELDSQNERIEYALTKVKYYL